MAVGGRLRVAGYILVQLVSYGAHIKCTIMTHLLYIDLKASKWTAEMREVKFEAPGAGLGVAG